MASIVVVGDAPNFILKYGKDICWAKQIYIDEKYLELDKNTLFTLKRKGISFTDLNSYYFNNSLNYLIIYDIDETKIDERFKNMFVKILNIYDDTARVLLETLKLHYINFYNKSKKYASCVIFDLDDTLTDETDKLLYDGKLTELIKPLKKYFTYIGIWSHGDTNHVNKILGKKKNLFDLVLVRQFHNKCHEKSAAHILSVLNSKFGVTSMFSILVDNIKENYTNDYTLFIHIDSNKIKQLKNFKQMAENIIKLYFSIVD
ncbi:MAG: hypothetical protein ACE1ZQ_00585 [Ignavibacteriaceae bacterium]